MSTSLFSLTVLSLFQSNNEAERIQKLQEQQQQRTKRNTPLFCQFFMGMRRLPHPLNMHFHIASHEIARIKH